MWEPLVCGTLCVGGRSSKVDVLLVSDSFWRNIKMFDATCNCIGTRKILYAHSTNKIEYILFVECAHLYFVLFSNHISYCVIVNEYKI